MPCRTSLGRSASCEDSPPICWNTLGTNANDLSFACSANSSIRRSAWPSFTLRNQSASRGIILRGNTRLCPQHPLSISTVPFFRGKTLNLPAAKHSAITAAQTVTQNNTTACRDHLLCSTGTLDLSRNTETSITPV